MVEPQTAGAPEALTLSSLIVLCCAGQARAEPASGHGQHIARRRNNACQHLGVEPAGRVRCGSEANPRANDERQGHPIGAGGPVLEVADELLLRSA